MPHRIAKKHQLGYRILRWVLATALLGGMLLSTLQIVLDAKRVSSELDQQAQQILALVSDAATQAIFSIDEELARQVVQGLLQNRSVRFASINHVDGAVLAQDEIPLIEARFRRLTDPIFRPERRYQIDLIKTSDTSAPYGTLTLWLDTAPSAEQWQERALTTLLSGIARALILGIVLYFVYQTLLTRPLFRIIRSLAEVNPEHPGEHTIETPKGHENDELGLWVSSSNQLLHAINEGQERRHAAETRINRLSRYDLLTGLPNRELFLSLLANALDEARRGDYLLAVFVCALNDFKSINEQFGYQQGDRLLQVLADRLSSERNHSPLTAARLGGDQFVVMEHRLRESFQAASTVEWLLTEMNRPAIIEGKSLAVTATIGVAIFPDDAEQADHLLQRAEQAMTLAKSAGDSRFQFYVATLDEAIRQRKSLEKDLNLALDRGEFHLVYQPQIDIHGESAISVETLLRWTHPLRGMIPPDHFIPLAESNRSIIAIGLWVLDQACAQISAWSRQGIVLRVAVNLSTVQLRQPNIVNDILEVLQRHELPAEQLELEITETSVMDNIDDVMHKLTTLREHGIQIALDDFGTGYSSLTYLNRLPVQHLKIDKQFVHNIPKALDENSLVKTIIDLGRSLHLNVIAEGVETPEQKAYLYRHGCRLVQGYLFSKPLPPDALLTFLKTFNTSKLT